MDLLDMFRNMPTPNEITGSLGEWLAKALAKSLDGALVLHDVLINRSDSHTSQIDLIIIGDRGICVVEVKTFSEAKIYGALNKSTWYYYTHGHKYEIYSPVKQNAKHIEYLKAMLIDFGDLPFFSCVAMFCKDFKISGDFDGKTIICNSLSAMERGLKLLASNNPVVINKEKKQEIFEYISNNQIAGKEARKEHKKDVVSYKNSMEAMKNQRICPYCKTELVLRCGKNGEFYGCKSFPKCRYTVSK